MSRRSLAAFAMPVARSRPRVPRPRVSTLEAQFAALWQIAQRTHPDLPDLAREVVFAAPRRWRWDVAVVGTSVAIELHGGTWTKGRHTRGEGFRRDREKMRAGVLRGWQILEFTAADLREQPWRVLGEVIELVGRR